MILKMIRKSNKKKENSAGGVVFYRDGKDLYFLLIKTNYALWSFPKGHIEGDEKPYETAEREIMEETGVKGLTLVDFLGSIRLRFVKDYDGSNDKIDKMVAHYLFKADNMDLNPKEADHEAKWVREDEVLKTLGYENVRKLFKKAIKKINNSSSS